jgi:hypothetical protein
MQGSSQIAQLQLLRETTVQLSCSADSFVKAGEARITSRIARLSRLAMSDVVHTSKSAPAYEQNA